MPQKDLYVYYGKYDVSLNKNHQIVIADKNGNIKNELWVPSKNPYFRKVEKIGTGEVLEI